MSLTTGAANCAVSIQPGLHVRPISQAIVTSGYGVDDQVPPNCVAQLPSGLLVDAVCFVSSSGVIQQ
jgi:hypothetical protein